jgi:hypothetical protein
MALATTLKNNSNGTFSIVENATASCSLLNQHTHWHSNATLGQQNFSSSDTFIVDS